MEKSVPEPGKRPLLTVFKIGGNVLDNDILLESMLRFLTGFQESAVLIHGGGNIASVIMRQLGVTPRMVDGRRITDKKTLDIVTMVYAGLLNKNIVARLQSLGCNALGLSGADANVIPAHKRSTHPVDYGFVGDIDTSLIAHERIAQFLQDGLLPVFAPITHDRKGSLLNTNADVIASSVAIALSKQYRTTLIFCFDKPGVLLNPDDNTSAIPRLNEHLFHRYKNKGIITTGMIPKLESAFAALKQGVTEVRICGPEAFDEQGIPGTIITAE